MLKSPGACARVPSKRIEWRPCEDVESKPDVMSGAGPASRAQAVIENAEDGYAAEQIVAEIYPSLPVEPTRRVIEFAQRVLAASPAG